MTNKFDTIEFRKTLVKMASHDITCGDGVKCLFTSYRTPDNKHFFLLPGNVNPYVIKYGDRLKVCEVDYIVIGMLGMTK